MESVKDEKKKAAPKPQKVESVKDEKKKAAPKAQKAASAKKKPILPALPSSSRLEGQEEDLCEGGDLETPSRKRKAEQCGDGGMKLTPDKKLKGNPLITHEGSRKQFLVRTGFKGPGQNEVFSYGTGRFLNDKEAAHTAAKQSFAHLKNKIAII